MSASNRYSEKELEEFRLLIEEKLEKARIHLEKVKDQIREITENTDDEYGNDWFDDTGTNYDVDLLSNTAGRQEKYIQSLENALLRIRNKTYGICTVTGKLIDKKRLIAVPTTTKSLEAKVETGSSAAIQKPKPAGKQKSKPRKAPGKKKSVIITKVIKKNPSASEKAKGSDDEFDLLNEEVEEDTYFQEEGIDFDSFPAEELDEDQLDD
jgi:RNA polymerase-binding transcription factor DksA